MLQKFGYRIRFLNTINMNKSMHYNPFAYHAAEPVRQGGVSHCQRKSEN